MEDETKQAPMSLEDIKAFLGIDETSTMVTREAKGQGRRLSTIEETEVSWLWQGRLPLEKVVLLTGEAGILKTFLACELMAHVTTGKPWFDGSECPIGECIIIAKEDDASDTLIKRIRDANGDIAMVTEFSTVTDNTTNRTSHSQVPISFPSHLRQLDNEIRATNAVLVVIDPILTCMDKQGESCAQHVMNGLIHIARQRGCCILLLNHLTKGKYHTDNIVSQLGGSRIFHTASRVSMLAVKDTIRDGVSNLMVLKSSVAKNADMLSYRLVSNELGQTYIQWLNADVENERTQGENIAVAQLSKLRQTILLFMFKAGSPVTPYVLANALDIPSARIRAELRRMLEHSEVEQSAYGVYVLPEKIRDMFTTVMRKQGVTSDPEKEGKHDIANDETQVLDGE